jgi:predicted dehydrogenase
MSKKKEYGIKELAALKKVGAPELDYRPPSPRKYNPPIAVVGCGGISEKHLAAYKKMELNVVAICDRHPERAEQRRREFFPDAGVYTDYREVLRRDEIEVVDFTTYPQDREYQIPDALNARKHVLSQKPFVTDLDRGAKLVELAEKSGVTLAVNQNGRWAPHFSYIRAAVTEGLLGEITAAHCHVHWDHGWIEATKFNQVHHIVLYDFGIHWFDMLHAVMRGQMPKRVFSTLTRAAHQSAKPPLLAQTLVEYDGAQASFAFDAVTKFGHLDETYVTGTRGAIVSRGRDLTRQDVTLYTGKGVATPKLRGTWFVQGFMGAMGELLCAIEQKRAPLNSAADNLNGLAICFAAVRSAETGQAEPVGSVRTIGA